MEETMLSAVVCNCRAACARSLHADSLDDRSKAHPTPYPVTTVPRPAPTAQEQLDFLAKVERLLAEGRFTSTYKFALLIALTNIAVEQGDDSGNPLEIDLDDVARQFLALYWNMARPYPRVNAILKQNREAAKPSRMITLLKSEVKLGSSSYARLRIHRASRDALVTETRRTLAKDVLYRLQSLGANGADGEPFLYDHPPTAAGCAALRHLRLKPGVGACLRRLRGVVVAIVQARWALWIRENNASLAADRELESFLFGTARTSVAIYAERFYELQDGRCLYTGDKLAGPKAGEVDHFIPWSRYPFDSPFNLALTSRKLNNKLRDSLKPVEWRARWLARNDACLAALTRPAPAGFGALAEDAETVKAISRWIYAIDRRAGASAAGAAPEPREGGSTPPRESVPPTTA